MSNDLRYTKDHEWVRLTGKTGRIGITDHAQQQLGDVVFVELPKVGSTVTAGTRFGTVESVKAVSELFCPVTGKVTAVNDDLQKKPETVNSDPYGAAWMIEVEVTNTADVEALLSAADYDAFVKSGS
ncbi:MAG: glycine cleavage system protein GcvH [Vicinamibacteria bacterium]